MDINITKSPSSATLKEVQPQANSKSATVVEPGDSGQDIRTTKSPSWKSDSSDNKVSTGYGSATDKPFDGIDSIMPAKNSDSKTRTTEFSK